MAAYKRWLNDWIGQVTRRYGRTQKVETFYLSYLRISSKIMLRLKSRHYDRERNTSHTKRNDVKRALDRPGLIEYKKFFFDKYVYWSSHSKVTFVYTLIKFMRYKYNLWMHLWTQMIGYFYIYFSNIIYTFSNKLCKKKHSYKSLVP